MTTPDLTQVVWRKSTYSGDNGGACVELAFLGTTVGLRDSKDQGRGPILTVTSAAWDAFLAKTKVGEFSRL
jgi:hypothetical protein